MNLKIVQFVREKDREVALLDTGEVWDRVFLDNAWTEWRFYLGLVDKGVHKPEETI